MRNGWVAGCRRFSCTAAVYGGRNDSVRIGCSSGFWGDTSVAAPQLVKHGQLDYLVSDYLSEITMSLLTAAKAKRPDMGYTPDFVQSLGPLLGQVKEQGLKVVSNAGGINPTSCVDALRTAAKKAGVDLSIATVVGDDLLAQMSEVGSSGVREMDSGDPLPDRQFTSMNAYLGAFPIAEALEQGADIVVTGRCADSALVLGPLIHKFGWKKTDFDKLAAGSLAGHIIECGAQATGGVFTDWDRVSGWDNMGFPIVECSEDGMFTVSKPEGTGGLISVGSVAEQLVYEIGDPRAYLLPDVSCDFSNVQMEEISLSGGGATGVKVSGAKGNPPTDTYKVSATYADGYRAVSVSPVIGPRVVEKSQKVADAILSRTRGIFRQLGMQDYSHTHVQMIGSGASYGPSSSSSSLELASRAREVVMWIGVQHKQKQALEIFAREVAPAGTGMAPGQTTLIGGRPQVSPVLRLFSFLYPKTKVPVTVEVGEASSKTQTYPSPSHTQSPPPVTHPVSRDGEGVRTGERSYRLEELAFLRSGDKGNSCNIGVVARKRSYLPYIQRALTSDAVAKYFAHLLEQSSQVERYELAGIGGLNFVLTQSLGGGGVCSLRIDPQGKAYAQMLADFELINMPPLSDL